MLAIAFGFRANRFHATQWGRHVNEGVPEWPPSPWRILRAIVSVWARTLPEVSGTTVVPILERLAAELPSFHLPVATTAHTRHYMPWEKKGPGDRTLVLDPFVVTEPKSAVVAIWREADLTSEERDLLARLLANLGYLGRAESWCDAQLIDSPPEPNCFPLEGDATPPGDWEITRVLAPKISLKLKDLCVDTADLRGGGRIDPPGARWCQYVRPANCFSIKAGRMDGRPSGPRPTVFRYALAGSVLPLVTDTLRIAELARKSVMAQYGRANGNAASPILSGKAPDGAPLEGHQHAFYLPTDENYDGHIDHLTVWVPGGLGEQELDALARVRALNPGGGRPQLQVAFLAQGKAEDFRDSARIFGTAQTWMSATPFVLNRHVKLRGVGANKRLVDGPADQVRRELGRRAEMATSIESIEPVPASSIEGWRTVQPLEFYRWRRSGSESGGAYNFRLRFKVPVTGPIALGYACHFGLGLFVPAD